jgi:tRNA pseudouridine13 synthase
MGHAGAYLCLARIILAKHKFFMLLPELFAMILKQTPDDFQVDELADVQPSPTGDHRLYRLEKVNWTTPDALAAVRRRWKIDLRRLSYGGLKDRHGRTTQYFTIFRGPERGLTHQGIRVHYLGRIGFPFTSEHIRANRFHIVVRRLDDRALARAAAVLDELRYCGVPNYFDDQRFGSVSQRGAFLARHLLHGRFEDALRQALTASYEFDRAAEKKEKALLRRLWGDWPALKEQLPRSHARSLVSYLVDHPSDFRGAIDRLRPELRGLYLSAYQSHLWNRMLAHWLARNVPTEQLTQVQLKLGPVPMHRNVSAELLEQMRTLKLPLHSARTKLDPADARKPYFDAVLAEEGVTLDQFKLKGLHEMFFSKGERAVLCMPENLAAEPGDDDTRPGKRKLTLSFDLSRGSYATLIVKRLQA